MFFPSWLEAVSCLLVLQASTSSATVIGPPYPVEHPPSPYHHQPAVSNGSTLAPGQHGAIASESAICSGIGRDLLLQGGTAADAMVGTVFCVGVIGMYHSGIGGGGFMLVRGSDGEYEFIDFRESAPAAAFEDMYKNDTNLSIYGGLASGVPGEIRGMAHLHEKYGKLPWKTVMQGAIKVARDGFPVTPDLVRYMASALSSAPTNFLVEDPNWAIDFAPNGTLVKLNDTITRKRYATTLEIIAEQGPNAFYEGPIAEATINTLQAANGTMTMEDLANYTVAIRDHAKIDYRGYKLHAVSAPASGGISLAVMKILEGYNTIGEEAYLNLSTHRLDEAIKFGYGIRASMGDPLYVEGMDRYQDEILQEKTAEKIRGLISDTHVLNTSAYDPSNLEILDTPGTSHIVSADSSGMAISLTTTVNLLFGSQVIVPSTGVIMNNEMNDFSIPGKKNAFGLDPSESNFVRPGKRPMSSIACTIAEREDGSLYFVTGSAGGSRIITATLQTLWNVLDRNMTSAEALAEPRLHDQLSPNVVSFEYAYNNATVDYMSSLGHNVSWIGPGQSTAQCLRVLSNGTFEPANEPRQLNSGAYAV